MRYTPLEKLSSNTVENFVVNSTYVTNAHTNEHTNRWTERRKLYNSRHKCRGYNNSKVFIFWGWHVKHYNTNLTNETVVPIWPRYEITKLGTKWFLLSMKWPKSGYEMIKVGTKWLGYETTEGGVENRGRGTRFSTSPEEPCECQWMTKSCLIAIIA